MLIDEIKAAENEPRFHGTGFTQLYLSPTRRVHVWHPDLPPTITNGLIHDHSFSFKSEIVKGDIFHEVFSIGNPEDASPHDDIVTAWVPPPKGGMVWERRYEHGELVPEGAYWMKQGSRYTFPAQTFHRVIVHGIAVTVVDKIRDYEGLPCRVLSHTNDEPEDAFGEVIAPGRLWRAIFEAVYDG